MDELKKRYQQLNNELEWEIEEYKALNNKWKKQRNFTYILCGILWVLIIIQVITLIWR